MIFYFKKKKLIINAFISEKFNYVYNYNPIDYANKFYPEWWKKLPKQKLNYDIMQPETNMKACAGLIEHYKKGFIIPMWSDLMIKTDKEKSYRYQFSDEISSCVSHTNNQFKNFRENSINLKIISPWLLESEKNINFVFLPAYWNHSEYPGYEVMIGTVDFYNQRTTNINLLIEGSKNILISMGQPMLHIIPLTDKQIIINKELISDNEWNLKFRDRDVSFFESFYKFKREKENGKSKCPIH